MLWYPKSFRFWTWRAVWRNIIFYTRGTSNHVFPLTTEVRNMDYIIHQNKSYKSLLPFVSVPVFISNLIIILIEWILYLELHLNRLEWNPHKSLKWQDYFSQIPVIWHLVKKCCKLSIYYKTLISNTITCLIWQYIIGGSCKSNNSSKIRSV